MSERGSLMFRKIKQERMEEIGRCELCGSKRGLELHHCIPLICGGEDTEDNLILVCSGCHAKLTPRPTLTRLGIKQAQLDGKQIGLTKGTKLITEKSIKAKEIIKKNSFDFDGLMKDADVIRLCGISRNSYYKYKKELKEARV